MTPEILSVSRSEILPTCGRYYLYQHGAGGWVFYVGMGKQNRPRNATNRSPRWHECAKDGFHVRIVGRFGSYAVARRAESEMIKRMRPTANIMENRDHSKSIKAKQEMRDRPHRQTYVDMDHELCDRFRALSKQSGLSFSWLVRRAMYLSVKAIEREVSRIGRA
jgi:hypothetical protein